MRSALAVLLVLFALASALAAQDCPPLPATPILAPDSAAPGNMTRLQFFNYLVGVWFKPSYHVLQTVSCPTGTCLWVPWFAGSNECTFDKLHTDCNLTPDSTFEISCLASDEFSQAGMALAMSGRQADFANWVNTVRFLIGGSGTIGLPSWLAGRNGATFTIADPSDASDATARIIIALYIAANSDLFTDAQAKASYRALGDGLARKFIANDFATFTYTANDTTITHWLGGGYATARGNPSLDNMESWAGYYGDAVIALLAAFQSTNDPLFLSYAADTIDSYLLAARYDGSTFAVPPEHFKWKVNADGSVAPDQSSGQWGYVDGPRAVTLCKAPYLASLNDVDLGPRLTAYCTRWLQAGGVKRDAYKPNYTMDGKPVGTVQGGYYENGLGAAVNFALAGGYLAPKLDEARGHFATATDSFDYTSCMGIYQPAFLILNLGSAIGLDAKAFTRRSCSAADDAAPFLAFRDTCGLVADPFTSYVALNGTASDDARVTHVTYSLTGATIGSGDATGTTSWSIGPLSLNGGTTWFHATVEDASRHSASVDCPLVINTFLPGGRRRSAGHR